MPDTIAMLPHTPSHTATTIHQCNSATKNYPIIQRHHQKRKSAMLQPQSTIATPPPQSKWKRKVRRTTTAIHHRNTTPTIPSECPQHATLPSATPSQHRQNNQPSVANPPSQLRYVVVLFVVCKLEKGIERGKLDIQQWAKTRNKQSPWNLPANKKIKDK